MAATVSNFENEIDVSVNLVEQLVLSLDAIVTSNHDVQLLVDAVHSRVAIIHQQAEMIMQLRECNTSMLSTVSTQANTILQLELAKKQLEWEVTLLQDEKNMQYNPLPVVHEVHNLQLHHQDLQLQLGTQLEYPPSGGFMHSSLTNCNDNLAACVPPELGLAVDDLHEPGDDLLHGGDILLHYTGGTSNGVSQPPPTIPPEDIVKAKQQMREKITTMAATVDRIAKKYNSKRRDPGKPKKPGKKPTIVPKIFAVSWKLYDFLQPKIFIPDPCPVVNLARCNKNFLRNLPKPTLFPFQSCPQDPNFYSSVEYKKKSANYTYSGIRYHTPYEDGCGCVECYPPFFRGWGFKTNMGVCSGTS